MHLLNSVCVGPGSLPDQAGIYAIAKMCVIVLFPETKFFQFSFHIT